MKAAAAQPQQMQVAPLELHMNSAGVEVVDLDLGGQPGKGIIVTHMSGVLRVVIPLPTSHARNIGNLLADRPAIAMPGGALPGGGI